MRQCRSTFPYQLGQAIRRATSKVYVCICVWFPLMDCLLPLSDRCSLQTGRALDRQEQADILQVAFFYIFFKFYFRESSLGMLYYIQWGPIRTYPVIFIDVAEGKVLYGWKAKIRTQYLPLSRVCTDKLLGEFKTDRAVKALKYTRKLRFW